MWEYQDTEDLIYAILIPLVSNSSVEQFLAHSFIFGLSKIIFVSLRFLAWGKIKDSLGETFYS